MCNKLLSESHVWRPWYWNIACCVCVVSRGTSTVSSVQNVEWPWIWEHTKDTTSCHTAMRKLQSYLSYKFTVIYWMHTVCMYVCCSCPSVLWHFWLGDRKGIRPVKTTGCWFVGGDILTGALHVLKPQLSPPPLPLAPTKSRMESFRYRLNQVHLENGH